jgi:membrane-associated phospholipid phosphatase
MEIKIVIKQIKQFLILYLLVFLGCLVTKLLFSKSTIYFTINHWHTDFTDVIFPYITDLGEGWTTIFICVVVVLFNYRNAFLLATSYALTSIIAQIIKPIFNAPRPILYFKDQLANIHLVKGVQMLSHNSFPSGHTVTAFTTAVVGTYLCRNKNWGYLFLLSATLVGFSRMYLSEHFFEDVTGGSLLGVFLTIFWLAWLDSRKFLQSTKWNRGLLKTSKKINN